MHRHEQIPFTLQRDVEAIIVPAGVPVTLRADKTGFITQALGGSFTVYVEGNLFRVAGKDADALGQEVALAPELPPNATDEDEASTSRLPASESFTVEPPSLAAMMSQAARRLSGWMSAPRSGAVTKVTKVTK